MEKINLLKASDVVALTHKATFQLSKHGLGDEKAQVEAIYDISGSMNRRFYSGVMQNVTSRVLALAIPFDDNSQIDIGLFGSAYYEMPSATLENIEGYVEREILSKHSINEGTCYAKPLQAILNRYKPSTGGFFSRLLGQKTAPLNIPSYVMFFTDGDAGDKRETEQLLRQLSHYPVFIQFIGIGNDYFGFLEGLSNLDGRLLDNAGFMKIADINNVNDTQLFSDLLNEFPQWLIEARAKNILKK